MLDYERARTCYQAIKASSLVGLRQSLFQKARDYARLRADWPLLTLDERTAMDQRRSLAHNAFIDSVNIMSRNMAKQDEDNTWRGLLSDDRKLIGDFACYVHMFLGLEMR